MKTCALTLLAICLMTSVALSQFAHQGRGMYVDKFFSTGVNTAGSTIVDQNRSILSISSKENELLQYAKENHITYLILYDLHRVLGNPIYENYLCSFLQKAKTQYCIEYVGIASSCVSLFSNAVNRSNSDPILFSSVPDNDNIGFPGYTDQLGFVEKEYGPDDSLFYISEATKLNIRAAQFNETCSFKFDVMVSEYEFWNSSLDDCTEENLSKDQKYERFQTMIENMDVIRDAYNSTHSGHQLYVEAYLGYLNQNAIYPHQTIADWIDGTNNGKRRIDRINLHYYSTDAAIMYSRTVAGQNYEGYYNTRFLDFCQSSTTNNTPVFPIMSAEYISWGTGSSFLGSWFSKSINNNIFTAEKAWYSDWYNDAHIYSPGTVGHPAHGNAISPGGAVWFTSSQMSGHLNSPLLFTSNSPVCVSSGQNGTFQFNYQGPIEQGISYKFYIKDAGSSAIRCGSASSIAWPVFNGATQLSIDLNSALGTCSLPVGDYDAYLELTYSSSCTSCTSPCSVYVSPPQRVSIINSGRIVALTPTTVCQGTPIYLQASSSPAGVASYQWYDGPSQISGATGISFAPNASSTGMKNISCKITSNVGSCSANRSNIIPVSIQAYPTASISPQSYSGCTVVLKANPSGGNYIWQDGSTSSTYTTSQDGNYSVGVTVNACKSNASYAYQKINIDYISKTNTCAGTPGGTITVNIYRGLSPFSLSWSGPVSGSKPGLSAGMSTITDLPSGIYSISVTDANGCTQMLSTNPEILSYSQMSVIASSVPATCNWTNDGLVAITSVSGGAGAPYTFLWDQNGSVSDSLNGLLPGIYSVEVKDSANCLLVADLSVGVLNPAATPSISISVDPDTTICKGTNVTFAATVANEGSAPSYQWEINGINSGFTTPSFSTDLLDDGDMVSCVLSSSEACPSANPVTSNFVGMNIEEYPSVFSVKGGGSYCEIPGEGVPIELSGSQSGVMYFLVLNAIQLSGSSILGNGSAISFGNQTSAGSYQVIGSTLANCTSIMDSTVNISILSSTPWYVDADNDGYGDLLVQLSACEQPLGYIAVAGDCNDNDSLIHPGMFELCNHVDDNCNGIIDENTCNSMLRLNLFIQGYYKGGLMAAALFNSGVSSLPDDCDSIHVFLVDALTMNETENKIGILKTNGESEINFSSVSIGRPYYIKIRQRNSLETWSSKMITLQSINQYSFSEFDSAAYGKNQVEVAPGTWAFWSGDISSLSPGIPDGLINESDYVHFESEIADFKSGYFPLDLNGDGIIESSDFSVLENNVNKGLFSRHP